MQFLCTLLVSAGAAGPTENFGITNHETITMKLRAKLRNPACNRPVLLEAYANGAWSWFPCVNASTTVPPREVRLLRTSVCDLSSCYLEMITAAAEQKEPYSLHSLALMSDGKVAEVFQSLPTILTFSYTTHASSVLCQLDWFPGEASYPLWRAAAPSCVPSLARRRSTSRSTAPGL